jgi:DNA-binding GntR family transcriptional regulator
MNENAAEPIYGRTRRRYEDMYKIIRTRISLLDYQPGQRLSEEVLAEEFGVSRTPIRRVLASLENEGLLRSKQGVGTIVTDVDIDALAQTYQLRMELAELIGRLDPRPVTDDVMAAFRAILERCRKLEQQPDPRTFAQINIDFFHALASLTENQPLKEISERLYYRTTRIWIKSINSMDLAEEVSIFTREVADILDAVEIGDLEAVGHIRRSHISMSFRRLRAKAQASAASST